MRKINIYEVSSDLHTSNTHPDNKQTNALLKQQTSNCHRVVFSLRKQGHSDALPYR